MRVRSAVGVVLALLAAVLVVAGGAPATAVAAPGDTQLVSVAEDGGEGTGNGSYGGAGAVAVSADGRYAAFDTVVPLDPVDGANDLSYGDSDVYVRDLRAPGHTVLISQSVTPTDTTYTPTAPPGPVAARGESRTPSLSATGRFVAFATTADNLPDGDHDAESDIVVCDRDPDGDGVFDEHAPDGSMAYRYIVLGRYSNGEDYWRAYANDSPSIAADGMTVVWNQHAIDSVDPPVVVAARLSLRDGVLTAPPESDYLDIRPAEADEAVEGTNDAPVISADGRYVAFGVHFCGVTCTTAFAGKPLLSLDGTDSYSYCYRTGIEVADLTGGGTVRVDLGPGGEPLDGMAGDPTISGDGRIVAFTVAAVDADRRSVYAVDRDPDGDGKLAPGGGEPVRSTIVSRDNSGEPADGSEPVLSADGRYLAFATAAPNMHDGVDPPPGHTEGLVTQVVLRDRVVDAQRAAAHLPPLPGELVSVSVRPDCLENPPTGTSCGGGDSSFGAALSGDGHVIGFESWATDLVDRPQECCASRVFARTLRPFAHADPPAFGTVPVGSATTRTITVRHNGFGPLRITGVSVPGPEFAVFPAQTCVDATLYETGSCLVSVRFTPSAAGSRAAVLRIDVIGAPPTYVPLTGTGGGVATGFHATPNPLVFPGLRPALSPSGPATVTIANGGPVSWRIGAVRVIGGPHLSPGDFRITANSCAGATLASGASCRITLLATAHGGGVRRAALSIADTSAGSPHLIGLAVTATTPILSVSPGVLPSGRVATVTGQGFPLSHDVALTRRDAAPVTVHTTSTGTFTAPLVIFDHALVGTAPVTATVPGTSIKANAPLLIVLGTFQPPAFTGRR